MLLGAVAPLQAQTAAAPMPADPVVSAAPEAVSVTVYRDKARSGAIDRAYPQGFALITEQRTVAIPAGRATIRFEGVAGNIFPESAIVSGLPSAVREKNLDADLLSPRTLFDRALGRRVIVRRTDPATGKVREEQAVIRSGADGAALVQLASGYEALRCGGAAETLVFPAIPAGLSAKPTFSIETDSPGPQTATLTLSYLAGGFDWQADYVVRIRPDGADMFAWVTLASSDVTRFADARTQVVAGKPNRVNDSAGFGDYGSGALALSCYASGPPGFEDVPSARAKSYDVLAAPVPAPPAVALTSRQEIVVTGFRKAVEEALGDFKLYRVPQPVTVAARAQKQVAFLEQPNVAFTRVYLMDIAGPRVSPPSLTLRAKNRKDAGLGIALPAGNVAVFEAAAGRPILIGEARVDDKAVGEEVEYRLGHTPAVSASGAAIAAPRLSNRARITVRNANPWPVTVEGKIALNDGERMSAASARLSRKDGAPLWVVRVPANGTAMLDYATARRGNGQSRAKPHPPSSLSAKQRGSRAAYRQMLRPASYPLLRSAVAMALIDSKMPSPMRGSSSPPRRRLMSSIWSRLSGSI